MAEKKSSREVKEGVVASYIHATKKLGSMVEVLCETDFVAHSDPVKELIHNLVMHIAAMNPETVDELLKQPFVKDESRTIDGLIKQVIAKTGENMRVERFARYEL